MGLLLIAMTMQWHRRLDPGRIVILLVLASVLLIGHLHAFACTAMASVAAEFGACRREQLLPRRTIENLSITALPFIIPLLAWYLLPNHYSPPFAFKYIWRLKLEGLRSLFELYNPRAEAVLTLGCVATFLFARWRGWIVVPHETAWIAISLMAAFLILPFSLAGSDFADYRIPIFFTWCLLAGSVLPVANPQIVRLAIVLITLSIGNRAISRCVGLGFRRLLTRSMPRSIGWNPAPAYLSCLIISGASAQTRRSTTSR